MNITALVTSLLVVTSTVTASRAEAPVELEPTRHAVYVELASGLVTNALTVSYDYRFADHFALRAGYGASLYFLPSGGGGAHGPLLMVSALLGEGTKRWEIGLGASLVRASNTPPFDLALGDDWYVVPNAFIGVRRHDPSGGFMFRAGIALSSAWGAPLSVAIGGAF